MTLKQLADFVCLKVNQQESEDKAACMGFLQRRLEMIWNDQLWKDSIVEYSVAIDPEAAYTPTSVYLPTKGVLLLPTEISRVLAVRTTERALRVARHEVYYRQDPDTFNATGVPLDFVLLSACVWEFDSNTHVSLFRSNEADNGSVSLDLLDTNNGTDIARTSVTLTASETIVGEVERIDAIIKATTSGTVSVRQRAGVTIRNDTDAVAYFTTGSFWSKITLAAGETGAFATPPTRLFATALDGAAILAILAPTGDDTTIEGSVVWDGSAFTYTKRCEDSIVTMAATDTTAALRQRIRMLETPEDATTVRVLGKRKCPRFSDDNDQPPVRGMDNLLIAMAQGDMLERERQYGKANLKFQEGVALLEQFKAAETIQQAHNQRIIPDSGFGDPAETLWR